MNSATASRSDAPAAAYANPKRWWILVVVSLAEFMVGLDATVVNVMTPSLQNSLGLSTTGVQWVVSVYVVSFGGLLLLGGRLTDVLGRRRVLLGGVTLFTIGSILAGFAHGETQLLLARAVQGIGAAALSPAALSILIVSFPDKKERTKAFGVWATIIGIGASIGTLLGGVIVNIGWRWAFYINIPVGVLLAAGAIALIARGDRLTSKPKSDTTGALVSTAGLLLLVFGIVDTTARGWGSALTVAPLAGAVVLLTAFVWIESTTPEPLLPLRLFRQRAVVAGSLGQFLVAGLMLPTFFMLPQYMQIVLGYSPLKTGLAYIPTSVAILVFATLAAKLLPKVGASILFTIGALLLAVMAFMMLGATTNASYWTLLLPVTALLGTGLVLCLVPTPVVGTSQATEEDAGTVSAVLNASTQIGGAIGLAVVVTVLTSRLNGATGAATHAAKLTDALHGGFAVLFVWVVLAVLVGLLGFRSLPATAELAIAAPAGAPV